MNDSAISALNKELEAILVKNDEEVDRFLRAYIRREYVRRFVKWLAVAMAISCAIYWVPTLNWNATAVGRLVLIKLVLPFYNWEQWSNTRCLIEWTEGSSVESIDEHGFDSNVISSHECSTCENLSKCFLPPFSRR